MLVSPSSESSLQLVLEPVDHDFFELTLFLVGLARVLQPGIEASSHLHLRHSAHVVSHNFL